MDLYLLRDWQKRLRLQDWRVELEIVPFLETFGKCDYNIRIGKYATIQICDPQCIAPSRPGVRDMEVTLVHELLHLHHAPIDHLVEDDSPEDDALEVMIECTAIALVEAKRGETVL